MYKLECTCVSWAKLKESWDHGCVSFGCNAKMNKASGQAFVTHERSFSDVTRDSKTENVREDVNLFYFQETQQQNDFWIKESELYLYGSFFFEISNRGAS